MIWIRNYKILGVLIITWSNLQSRGWLVSWIEIWRFIIHEVHQQKHQRVQFSVILWMIFVFNAIRHNKWHLWTNHHPIVSCLQRISIRRCILRPSNTTIWSSHHLFNMPSILVVRFKRALSVLTNRNCLALVFKASLLIINLQVKHRGAHLYRFQLSLSKQTRHTSFKFYKKCLETMAKVHPHLKIKAF